MCVSRVTVSLRGTLTEKIYGKKLSKILILQKFIIQIVGENPCLLDDRNSVNITSLKIKKDLQKNISS